MLRRLSVGVVLGMLVLSTVGGRLPQAAASAASNAGSQFGKLLWLPPTPFDPLKVRRVVSPALASAPQDDLYVAQLDVSKGMRLAQDSFFARAITLNARVLGYVPEAAYLVRIDRSGAEQLRSVSRAVVPFHPAYRITPQAATSPILTVVTLPDSDALQLAQLLRLSGFSALASSNRIALVKNRPGLIERLAVDSAVLAIEPQGTYKAFNTDARWVTQSVQRDYTPLTSQGLNGTNEAVAIADTGVDYYPDQVGQANYYFSDCPKPLAPTVGPSGCKLADYTYAATSPGNLQTGTVTPHGTNHRKVIAYFDEVGDGQGDSGSSTHGSHTSGSIAGSRPVLNANGTVASYPGTQPYDGQAPKAKLVFQDIGNSNESLTGLPGDLYQLFDQAYDVGQDQSTDNTDFSSFNDLDPADSTTSQYQRGFTPRIHSNSWGSIVPEVSLGNSPRLDDFVVSHEDFLPVFAAGNSGPNGATIGEPGTAKDALTVGAMANGRDDYASLDTMANFSSHGAATFPGSACSLGTPQTQCVGPVVETGEIKPDVATPGLHMISPKGGTDTAVQVLQGTSMATPTAAGDAVLVRQYFDDGFGPSTAGNGLSTGSKGAGPAYNASAALVKAVMIASAQRMQGLYTGDTSGMEGQWPSTGQGWGRVQLDSALHFVGVNGSPQLFIKDATYALGGGSGDALATGDVWSRDIYIGSGQPLRVVLDWSDPGGLISFLGLGPEALTNNLQLEVDAPGASNIYCGNNINTRTNPSASVATSLSSVGGCSPIPADNFNNVQVVHLPNPAPGKYTIKVRALLVNQPQDSIGLTIPTGGKQGFALAATGNLADGATPGAISPVPPPSGAATVTSFTSTSRSGDAAVLHWTTNRPTTSAVTITGPGGYSRTEEDEYSFEQSTTHQDFPGLSLAQVETSPAPNFLHRPAVSASHEIKLTGLSPGTTYHVSFSANGLGTGFSGSFRTPATSYAPQVSTDTATLFSLPLGVGPPIADPTNDPWGKSSQFYVGQLPDTIATPVTEEQAISAFKFVTPSNAPTNNLAGAAVLLTSRHDITSHDQEIPATSIDLLAGQADGAGWGTGTGYGTVSGYPATARLFPNFADLRTSALTVEPYTFTCNDLAQLTTSVTTFQQARFRASGSNNKLDESLYAFESGFGRRSTGLEYRPLLVLFPSNSDPLHQAGGVPTITDVRVERTSQSTSSFNVYWQTNVPANAIVLVRVGSESFQVGSPAYTLDHQVQINGVAATLGATFAARSVSSTGQMTTSGAYAVPDAIGSTPPAPAPAQAAAGNFSTTPTHQFATMSDRTHGTGYGCAAPPPPPTCHEGDGGGQMQGHNGGNAQFQSDEDSCEDGDQNNEQMQDPGAHEDFHSTQVNSMQFDDGAGTMTITGVGVANGLPVTFLIVEQAATADLPAVYTIQLSDGYVNTGTLLSGSITLQ